MAIVVDAARPLIATKDCATETYTKGNDNANTPDPTFDIGFSIAPSFVETHVTARGDVVPWAPVDNTADQSAPIIGQETFFLDSTPAA